MSASKHASAAPLVSAEETGPLARELGRAFHELATFYRDQMDMTPDAAAMRASGADDTPEQAAADTARIASAPADQVSWFELNRLAHRDPADALAVWSRLKQEARDELASGHRAALALEWDGRPWGRAQFLAIRDGFRQSGAPADPIEAAMLDTAAQCYSEYLEWTGQLQRMGSVEEARQEAEIARSGHWRPSHVSTAAAIDQAAERAEAVHRRMLRTLAALDERRRQTPATIGGPVDVAFRVREAGDEPISDADTIRVTDNRDESDAA